MRPLKLTMSAFGPYADETVIDFRTLGTSGVYLVCGDTGSKRRQQKRGAQRVELA